MIKGETLVFIGIAVVITGMLLTFIGTAILSSGKNNNQESNNSKAVSYTHLRWIVKKPMSEKNVVIIVWLIGIFFGAIGIFMAYILKSSMF